MNVSVDRHKLSVMYTNIYIYIYIYILFVALWLVYVTSFLAVMLLGNEHGMVTVDSSNTMQLDSSADGTHWYIYITVSFSCAIVLFSSYGNSRHANARHNIILYVHCSSCWTLNLGFRCLTCVCVCVCVCVRACARYTHHLWNRCTIEGTEGKPYVTTQYTWLMRNLYLAYISVLNVDVVTGTF